MSADQVFCYGAPAGRSAKNRESRQESLAARHESKETIMRINWTKSALGAMAAMTLALAVATPASAQYYRGYGGGWHGGYGGGWHGGYGGGGWGAGPAVAAGVLGGLALGAVAAGAARGPYYGGGECWIERRPVYDEYGDFLGRRRMRVCN
jgi:hypothetical protein